MQMIVGLGCVALLLACGAVLMVRAFRSPGEILKRLSVWNAVKVLGEAFIVVVCLAFVVGVCWTYFGIGWHRLPMTVGDMGRYGVIEDAKRFVPGTKIIKFEPLYVPSRIVWVRVPLQYFERAAVPWPVPETIDVHIEYQRPNHAPEEFDQTYLLACSVKEKRDCIALYQLIGMMFHGKGVDADGQGGEYKYVYLRGQLLPQHGGAFPGSQPAPPAPPKPSPPKRPPMRGALIA